MLDGRQGENPKREGAEINSTIVSEQTPQANIRYASTPDARLYIPHRIVDSAESLHNCPCSFTQSEI